MEERNLTCSVKNGGGSQVAWGCKSANWNREIHFIEGIIDHKVYIGVPKQNFHKSAEKIGLSVKYIFTQDYNPNYVALNKKLWILYNVLKWI